MPKKKKKLRESEINRNFSPEISHTIRKIKENEFKYTVFLVLIFMMLFILIGYHTLSINTNSLIKYNENSVSFQEMFISSEKVTLTSKNVMNDFLGLQSYKYNIDIANNTSHEVRYQVLFQKDDELTNRCGCSLSSDDFKNIHYSLDGENVKDFSNDNFVVFEDVISSKSRNSINIQMWLAESFIDGHIHGEFVIREMK